MLLSTGVRQGTRDAAEPRHLTVETLVLPCHLALRARNASDLATMVQMVA
jgi:hypothetical protein